MRQSSLSLCVLSFVTLNLMYTIIVFNIYTHISLKSNSLRDEFFSTSLVLQGVCGIYRIYVFFLCCFPFKFISTKWCLRKFPFRLVKHGWVQPKAATKSVITTQRQRYGWHKNGFERNPKTRKRLVCSENDIKRYIPYEMSAVYFWWLIFWKCSQFIVCCMCDVVMAYFKAIELCVHIQYTFIPCTYTHTCMQ